MKTINDNRMGIAMSEHDERDSAGGKHAGPDDPTNLDEWRAIGYADRNKIPIKVPGRWRMGEAETFAHLEGVQDEPNWKKGRRERNPHA